MEIIRELSFPRHKDGRGHLVVVEGKSIVPFDIKRLFYIFGTDCDVVRGKHANRRTEFVMINVAGKSKLKVDDGLGNEAIYCLDSPNTGVYIPSMIWKEMYEFSSDSVLLVLASTHYDSNEYIRDYDAFVNEVRGEIRK